MPSSPGPSHDRLAVLDGALTDILPFTELTLHDPTKRMTSVLDMGRHLCGMYWNSAFQKLSQQVLHIPAETLRAMKVHLSAHAAAANSNAIAGEKGGLDGSGGRCSYVSTNDVVVAFVWMLVRRLRHESRHGLVRRDGVDRVRGMRSWFLGGCGGARDSGGRSTGPSGSDGFAMQAINMRGLGIHGFDPNMFGNASVMVAAPMPLPPPSVIGTATCDSVGGGGGWGGDSDDAVAAGAMAASMRTAVNAFKSKSEFEHKGSMLALASITDADQVRSVITGVALSDVTMTAWLGESAGIMSVVTDAFETILK